MPESSIALHLNGQIYRGWTHIKVTRSLDQFAHGFELAITRAHSALPNDIRLGTACQVWFDDELLITGYVDQVNPSYDSERHGITLSGRSKTADLVDCTVPTGDLPSEHRNLNLQQLAAKYGALFGIGASTDIPLDNIKTARINAGQTVYEFLDQYATQQGVMLLTNPTGDVLITRASKRRTPTSLVLGENIQAAQGRFSQRDRFSKYVVLDSAMNQMTQKVEAVVHVAADHSMRYRPTVLQPDTPVAADEAQRYGEWQRNIQYGRSHQATYTVVGWRHAHGLWQCNDLVRVHDAWLGFNNDWLMIGTVVFLQDDKGRRTQLTVMPPQAYDLMALPAKTEEYL